MPNERISFVIYPNRKPVLVGGDSGLIDGRYGHAKWDHGQPLTSNGCIVEFGTYEEAEEAAISMGLDPRIHVEKTRILVLPPPEVA